MGAPLVGAVAAHRRKIDAGLFRSFDFDEMPKWSVLPLRGESLFALRIADLYEGFADDIVFPHTST